MKYSGKTVIVTLCVCAAVFAMGASSDRPHMGDYQNSITTDAGGAVYVAVTHSRSGATTVTKLAPKEFERTHRIEIPPTR